MEQTKTDSVLNPAEREGILAVCALRRLEKRREIHKLWKIGRLRIRFHWGDPDSLMGRFGGGWNWKLGVQIGRGLRTWVFSLLVLSVTIAFERGVPETGR